MCLATARAMLLRPVLDSVHHGGGEPARQVENLVRTRRLNITLDRHTCPLCLHDVTIRVHGVGAWVDDDGVETFTEPVHQAPPGSRVVNEL